MIGFDVDGNCKDDATVVVDGDNDDDKEDELGDVVVAALAPVKFDDDGDCVDNTVEDDRNDDDEEAVGAVDNEGLLLSVVSLESGELFDDSPTFLFPDERQPSLLTFSLLWIASSLSSSSSLSFDLTHVGWIRRDFNDLNVIIRAIIVPLLLSDRGNNFVAVVVSRNSISTSLGETTSSSSSSTFFG